MRTLTTDQLHPAPDLTESPEAAEEARKAALTVAAHARDRAECADLLEMLGLHEQRPR
ncbi:hypothetical protein [Amycolatopsis sp. CA-230715]|uniref:hypothetical protein n=1 Tax=Amycolatopsis sp. CA-230715 TaxID=2745196 RepID=UPI001C02ADAE|nr:hypothetical protein [Amycolatopsis sp. CA-230715]QWF84762.1 hypothetical protein HUW46_08214 [Amycolatopsis sp. CA-230715]